MENLIREMRSRWLMDADGHVARALELIAQGNPAAASRELHSARGTLQLIGTSFESEARKPKSPER